jgi:hypothetical protein
MTDQDLIRRGDALMVADDLARGRINIDDVSEALRRLPAVDVAQVRADALREAADFCFWNASGLEPRRGFTLSPWTQEQGGKHPGMAYYAAILALIDRPAADPLADPRVQALVEALRPLIAIADAFDENELDDDARKFWGKHYEHENHTPHDHIELYSGRGGKRLLTLSDAMKARTALAAFKGGEA